MTQTTKNMFPVRQLILKVDLVVKYCFKSSVNVKGKKTIKNSLYIFSFTSRAKKLSRNATITI